MALELFYVIIFDIFTIFNVDIVKVLQERICGTFALLYEECISSRDLNDRSEINQIRISFSCRMNSDHHIKKNFNEIFYYN